MRHRCVVGVGLGVGGFRGRNVCSVLRPVRTAAEQRGALDPHVKAYQPT